MCVEEELLDEIDEGEDELDPVREHIRRKHERYQRKNRPVIDRFLGRGRRKISTVIFPGYYGELLTWALHRYMEKEGWKVSKTLGYRLPRPVYHDVSTDSETKENLLVNGQLVIEKGGIYLIVTLDINLRWRNALQVEGHASTKAAIDEFAGGVARFSREHNFYRGKKFQFGLVMRFLDVKDMSWDSIILDPAIKREVEANTVGFLHNSKRWGEYGIPLKRGILLAGEPGTGKTMICKALMAQSGEITCITTNAYAMGADEYITDLYEMAQDLSPSIVFIEDIDLIAKDREEYHYQSGSALLSLLSVLDGVEERREMVTVATANNLNALDKAIRHRPSRFDRVVTLTLPTLNQRRELIGKLCRRIPLDEASRDYIARRTERFTPAQVQEVIYGLALEYSGRSRDKGLPCLELGMDDIGRLIARINGKNKPHLGFDIDSNGRSRAAVGSELTVPPGESDID